MIIDFHTHPFMIQELINDDPNLERAVKDVFGLLFPAQPLEIFIKEMDAAGVDRSVLLPIDCTSAFGCKIVSNKAVSQLCKNNPRFIGFASVDPHLESAVEELETAVNNYGLKGLKLDPSLQKFDMNSENYAYPIYQTCSELGIPIVVHCGLNWAPNALTHNAYPLNLEPAIIAFPQTNFVIAHLGWPWVNEASILAMKYPNVYMDTSVVYSGTPAECLSHVVNNIMGKEIFERNLSSKIIYGSNYPRADMRRTMRGIKNLGFSDYLNTQLFEKNATNLLRL